MANEEINEEILSALEKRVDDLRNWFEQYFMGSRKRAPLQERTSVQYYIRRLSNINITNTRLRFRFQQIVAKFNAYNQHWNRTLQQIEAGTYFRDRFKANLRAQSDSMSEPGRTPPPPRGKEKGGISDDHIDEVYNAFVEARKQLNQSTNVSKDKLAESIRKQAPAIQEKYKGKQVRFKVVVEDGKAKLKATLK